MTETPETSTSMAETVESLLDAMRKDAHSCLRIESRWFLEMEMPVNENGEFIEGSPEDAPGMKWVTCTGDFARDDVLRALAFRQKKNPEDHLRLVRKDVIFTVEPLPTAEES